MRLRGLKSATSLIVETPYRHDVRRDWYWGKKFRDITLSLQTLFGRNYFLFIAYQNAHKKVNALNPSPRYNIFCWLK